MLLRKHVTFHAKGRMTQKVEPSVQRAEESRFCNQRTPAEVFPDEFQNRFEPVTFFKPSILPLPFN